VPVCGRCLQTPPPWSGCVAAVDYGWPWDRLIADFKFHGHIGLARHLAALMQAAEGMTELLAAAELVTAMPLSRQRLAERGYNQSLLLARCLRPSLACAPLLLRLRDTPPQRGLPRAERLHNLQGSMVVDPGRASLVRGRHVLLVDDVMTSGASLQAASLALLEAGAARVSAAVLARTAPTATDGYLP
jgi:ComF family protein